MKGLRRLGFPPYLLRLLTHNARTHAHSPLLTVFTSDVCDYLKLLERLKISEKFANIFREKMSPITVLLQTLTVNKMRTVKGSVGDFSSF